MSRFTSRLPSVKWRWRVRRHTVRRRPENKPRLVRYEIIIIIMVVLIYIFLYDIFSDVCRMAYQRKPVARHPQAERSADGDVYVYLHNTRIVVSFGKTVTGYRGRIYPLSFFLSFFDQRSLSISLSFNICVLLFTFSI